MTLLRLPGNPDTPATDCNYGPFLQGSPVSLKCVCHQGDSLFCRYIRETYQPRMLSLPHVYELSEVSVNRHQNPSAGSRAFQQFPIAGVVPEFPGVDDVMPLAAKPFR